MLQFIPIASIQEVLKIPLFTERCAAGFPSPAADYTEEELDLNAYCPVQLSLFGPLVIRCGIWVCIPEI